MTTVPTTPEPLDADPGHAHPTWCAADRCSAPDRLAERGVAERDVPAHRRGSHFGPAHLIPTTRVSEVEISLEQWRDAFQPVTDEPDGVLLTYHAEVCGHGGTMLLTGEQMAPLSSAFSSLRDAFEPDRNSMLDRVAESLRVLGCVDRSNAAALLALTALVLSSEERATVLAAFPPREPDDALGGSGPGWPFSDGPGWPFGGAK